MKNLFIIVLHYGDPKITVKCLDSVVSKITRGIKIIVVDNDPDSSFQLSNKLQKKIKILRNKNNLGYAGGMNVGIRYSLENGANAVLLLNNDTLIKQNIFPLLLEVFEKRDDVGIIAPAISFFKNQIKYYDLGGKVNLYSGKTSHNNVTEVFHRRPIVVDYVSGCCMAIKSSVIKKIGLFDERFFLYYEDVDFCIRAKHAGYISVVLPHINIFHSLSKSIGKDSYSAIYQQTKSALEFGKKHVKILPAQYVFLITQSLFFGMRNFSNGKAALRALVKK